MPRAELELVLRALEFVSRTLPDDPSRSLFAKGADALKDLRIQIGSASQNLASTVALAGTNTALTGAASQPQAPLSSFTRVTTGCSCSPSP